MIDDDESAEQRIAIGVVHDERAAGLEGDFGDVVLRDVSAVAGSFRSVEASMMRSMQTISRVEFLRGELELVALADGEVAFAHPEEAGLEAIRLRSARLARARRRGRARRRSAR